MVHFWKAKTTASHATNKGEEHEDFEGSQKENFL